MAGELLGEATLDLGADLAPLDRDLAAAKARVATAVAEMQAMLDRLHTNIQTHVGATQAVAAGGVLHPRAGVLVPEEGARAPVSSLGPTELERILAALPGRGGGGAPAHGPGAIWGIHGPEAAGGRSNPIAFVLEAGSRLGLGSLGAAVSDQPAGGASAQPTQHTAVAGMSERDLINAVRAASREEQSDLLREVLAAKEATSGGSTAAAAAAPEPAPTDSGANTIAILEQLRGRKDLDFTTQGSIQRVLNALGEDAAATERAAADIRTAAGGSGGGGGVVPPVAVSPGGGGGGGGGGGRGGFSFVPLPWWMGGGLHRSGGGGDGGGTFSRLLMGGGGLVAGTAALGSLGGFAGLGAEHILTTILGLGGSAVGGGIGAGLLGLGGAGQLAVGGGSDLGVLKSTIADTKALAEGYKKVQEAQAKYGVGSIQAKEATHELNLEMAALGNTAGVKAELGLAKSASALNEFWDKATSQARVQAVGVLQQVVDLGHSFVPRVAVAAQENLTIVNQGIKPLFSWLQGPQGVGIWNELENSFRTKLPTAIHAGTQGFEFFARLTQIASRYTGGLTEMLDHLFSRLNNLDNSQLEQIVGKFVADFRMWSALIKVVGQDLYGFFHQSQGQAGAIVTGLTHALERLREWEHSAKGEGQIRSIFAVHKEQIEALGHVLLPLLKAFGSTYLAVAPALVELTTTAMRAFTPIIEGLDDVLQHSKPLAILFAGLLVSIKAFGAAATWQGVKTALGWLTGAETAAAGAGNADAAAQARLAGAEAAAGAGAAGAAAGVGALGATELAGGGGVLVKGASGLSAAERANILVNSASSSTAAIGGEAASGGLLAGILARGGLFGKLAGPGAALAGRGGMLGMLGEGLGVGLPALAGGGIGFVGGNLVANMLGIHGGGKAVLEGATTGAGIGTAIAPGVGTLIGAGVGAGAAGLGSLLGLFSPDHVVNIKNWNQAIKGSPEQIQRLISAIKEAGHVSIAGINQPLKQVVESLEQAKAAQQHWNAEWSKSWDAIHKFALGSGPLLRELYGRFDANFRLIAHTVGTNSATGRKLGEENVSQMVSHVLDALHHGQLGTSHAMAAIKNSILEYTHATGDQTPRIYEAMFSKIDGMYANHEIGTKTAFTAFTTIAGEETDKLKSSTEKKYQAMFAHLKTQYQNGELTVAQYESKKASLAKHGASVVEGSMVGLTESILGAMEAGALSTKDGGKVIFDNLNNLLKAFGAQPLSMPQVEGYTATVAAAKLVSTVGKGVGSFFGGGGNEPAVSAPAGQGSSQGSNNPGQAVHAQGGLVQIGPRGAAGHDTVPMSIGGSDIMVGEGETAVILNRHQLPYVDAGLEMQGFGGLHGLFSSVTKPNHMATGGFVGYSLPLPRSQMMPGRWSIDQGVDIPAPAGTPEFAIGPGTIIGEGISGFGPNAPILRITSGPLTGRNIYYGHAGPDTVRVGASVRAGQQISSVGAGIVGISTGPHIEIGFGPPFGHGDSMAVLLHQLLGGAGVTGVGGASAASVPSIHAPHVHGTGAVHGILTHGLGHVAHAATHYLAGHAGAGAGVAGSIVGSPSASSGKVARGRFSKAQLEALWVQYGGSRASAHIAAAIALAESGGDPNSENHNANGTIDRGLWQINSIHGAQSTFDIAGNVRAAIAISSNGRNWIPWTTYNTGAYRQFMAGGGFVRGFQHGGRVTGHAARRPRGVVHAHRTPKPRHVSLSKLITTLGKVPGFAGAGAVGVPEGEYNLLSSESELLSSMTSNPASILEADMALLQPTLSAGENVGAGTLVPFAERELQRFQQREGETPALTRQGELLQFIGGLDDHRLLTQPDVGVLAKDFTGHAGHTTIHGVPFTAGFPVFGAQQRVLEAQLSAQGSLVGIERHQKDAANAFIKKKQERKRKLEHLLHITFARYKALKERARHLQTQKLKHALSAAQAKEAREHTIHEARQHQGALQQAITEEQGLPSYEVNKSLVAHWKSESQGISNFITALSGPTGRSSAAASEALLANQIRNQMVPLEESLDVLGGNTTKIGTSGELGAVKKQIDTLQTGRNELGAKITESVETTIPGLALALAQLQASLKEAEAVPPMPGPSKGAAEKESELNGLLKQQNEQLAQAYAVSQAQYKVLQALPPFAGTFHSGGVIPGPPGAERMALLQAGERVSAAGDDPEWHIHAHYGPGMDWLRDYVDFRVEKKTRGTARTAGRRLPSNGGGLAR
jgi:hypothetical protein